MRAEGSAGRVGLAQLAQSFLRTKTVAVHQVGHHRRGAATHGGLALHQHRNPLGHPRVDEAHDLYDGFGGPRGIVGKVDVEHIDGVLRSMALTYGKTAPVAESPDRWYGRSLCEVRAALRQKALLLLSYLRRISGRM